MKKAIVPGSFDPMTLGHLWVIHRAAELFDEVLVACMTNQSKQYLFTKEERVRIIEAAIPELNNVKVCASDEMLYQLAKREGATAILKGFRSPEDVTYELEHADFNREMCAGLETYLLPSPPYLRKISSTLVKQLWQEGKNLEGATTTETIRLLADKKKRSV